LAPSRNIEESDLARIWRAIRRRAWLVGLCFLAASLAAVLLTIRAEERYASTSALLLRASPAVDPQRAVDTNLQLLSLPLISARTADTLGMTPDEVEAAIVSSQKGESDIIEVTAEDSSPEGAARLANTFTRDFLAFREGGGANRERVQTGKVEVVDRASPNSSPVSPKPVRNVVFGALIGIVLGLGLALLLERLDRRLKREDDLAEATGLPLLASIPKREAFDSDHLGKGSLSPAETEVFRRLRANLRYFRARTDVRSVLVTSAEPGEGKTLVSLGLALAAVSSGERVLLLEADMRDPGLSRVLDMPASGGLSGYLTAEKVVPLDDVVIQVEAARLAGATPGAMLDIVPAGAIPPNPTELVESRRMKELIVAAEREYDFVVIDTPPVLVVSDAMPLIMAVSGVLAISGLGVSTHESAVDLAEQLDRLGVATLGLVANFAEGGNRSYEGYGYGRPPELDPIGREKIEANADRPRGSS
jgi:capsular exopolysaccharide synthesis family protein